MSGPYNCTMCGGVGLVNWSITNDDHTETCPTCKGTGEQWLPCVFCPSQEDRDAGRVEYVDGGWRFKKPHQEAE